MKKFVKNSLESVLSENCTFWTTDGRNHAVFHAESGSDTIKIVTSLNQNGLTFFFENYLHDWMEIIGYEVVMGTVESKTTKFSKIVLRIDELQGLCPNLYLELKYHNDEISKEVWQEVIDSNQINDYFIFD